MSAKATKQHKILDKFDQKQAVWETLWEASDISKPNRQKDKN